MRVGGLHRLLGLWVLWACIASLSQTAFADRVLVSALKGEVDDVSVDEVIEDL
ncbi:MAG: hypothetical protein ACO3T7_13105 [Pseudomonadales bacterium]